MKLKNKKMIIITISIIILILLMLGITGLINKSPKESDKLSITYSETGIPKFIDGTYTKEKIKNSNEALMSLNTIKEEMHFNDVEEEFELISEEINDNITYYKFCQKYKNIKVLNYELIISIDKNGNVLSLSGYYLPNIDIDINQKITTEEAEEIVKQDLGDTTEIISNELFIYNNEENQRLIYQVDASNNDEIKEYIIDANTKEIIFTIDLMEYASYEYTGEGLNGTETISIEEYQELMPFKTRYRFNDLNRKIEIKDGRTIGIDPLSQLVGSIFVPESITGDIENGVFKISVGNNTKEEIVKDAITAMKNYEDIYDYYKNTLGRDSYDNKGGKIVVHVGIGTTSEQEFNNAFWLKGFNQMFIGRTKDKVSISKAKDILGHEFTHGVISKTADFAKILKNKNEANETSALNEGIADIMGSLIEGNNWTIGEDAAWLLRDLKDPSKTNNPSAKGDGYWYPNLENNSLEDFLKQNNIETIYDRDNGGEHRNSTVVGHAAYLMEEKGAVKSKEQLALLWYNSLFLMSSYSNFEDCALAVIKTAKNMGLSPSSIEKIQEAFYETKMLEKTKYKVTGTVTSDNKEIANLKITLKSENNNKAYQLSTNTKGEFEFKDLPRGKYTIIIEDRKYKSLKKTFEITNKDIEENIKLEIIKTTTSTESDDGCLTYHSYTVENGVMEYINYNSDRCGKDLVIPAEIDGHKLEKLPSITIKGTTEITSVTIAEGITEIEGGFSNCKNLKEVYLPNSLEKIGDSEFFRCNIEKIKFGENLNYIGKGAFSGNKLTKVVIPNSVQTIGEYAFSNNNLTNVKLSESLETIEAETFNINKITNIVIPDSVKTIKKDAFNHNNIVNITIGKSVTNIEKSAFKEELWSEENNNRVILNGTIGGKIKKIINKSENAFSWEDIIGGTPVDESKGSFAKGIYTYKYYAEDPNTNEYVMKSNSIEITN